ncbi:putative HTH-type transcriptional regulator [Sinobacterium norvegicum]|uniref:HTH-type transcriptional regulator n=1 Tax=Sinobacterium norvegicum TaxID=1641715 RepID=A0ABN8EJT7_9GAMM|nr:AraC family transcriptional regulator [Sinobacterium norvegicum]CAH0992359.1 putative HTH-type transcriptional regulator [Sinobacterium norvegicum]
MPHDDHPQAIALWYSFEIQSLFAALRQQGVATRPMMMAAGVDPKAFENPALRLTTEQELRLYQAIAQANTDPLLGLRVGATMTLSHYGVLGLGAASCNTLGEALELLVTYAAILSPGLALELRRDDEQAVWRINPSTEDQPALALEVDATMASLYRLLSDLLLQPMTLTSVSMKKDIAPVLLPAYRQHYGCPVTASAETNCFIFESALLATRLPLAAPQTLRLMAQICYNQLKTVQADYGLVAAIRHYLDQRDGVASIEELARHFNQSSRTLRRHLTQAGYSYQSLSDEYRFNKAKQLLLSTAQSVESIALNMGFSDVRSFREAFKRWSNGQTPANFRRSSIGS